VASWSANRLDVFVRGARQTMLHRLTTARNVPSGAVAREVGRLDIFVRGAATSAGRKPGMAGGWATTRGRTADVKPGRSVLGAESAGCVRPGRDNALYGDSRTLGCDYVQQHIKLQPLICSALLYSLDPVVGGLCMHILGLSLE
jgi:hypothetical protein